MTDTVLPIETILFQVLFLLVAIALEARVFHKRLRIPRKTSVEYATSINLLTATIGWLIFFSIQELLPQSLRTQVINYIFFDRPLPPQSSSLNLIIASTGMAMFFASFLIKLKGLELLQALLETSPQTERQSVTLDKRRRLAFADRMNRAITHTDTNQATVVLLANAYSNSAILLLLFLRFLQLSTLG